ncbi:MAG: DUF1573 domain-containing protein [Planctomycetaceae bacterium]|jgi:hypothetical protein|nr:DUF1573 domain-containing protein [Planctomycetaceae bacterium]
MRRIFILLISVLLLIIAVYFVWRNGYGAAEPIHPVELISGLMPEKCDLGYVESKSVHDFTLEITNASDKDWQVDKIEIECDCVTVLESPKSVSAKSKSLFQLRFTAPDVTGSYTKTIKITANGKMFQTRFHARIDAPLRVEPKVLIFSGGENITEQSFTIFNEGNEPIRLLYATSIPAVCTVKIGAEPITPCSQTTIFITLNDFTPNRLISLNIQTNHRKQKKMIIPIQVK